MSQILEMDIKIIKCKIERLIGNVDYAQQYKYVIFNLIFNFDRFINYLLINYNLGTSNKLIFQKFSYFEHENYNDPKFELIKNEAITNIKLRISNNINILWDYITTISLKNNPDFYQCLSCIYGTICGDCFQIHKLSKYYKVNIFLVFAIMDNVNLHKIDPDLIDYYYLIWFMLTYNNSKTKNLIEENYFQFEGKFSEAGLKCAINESFYTVPYNNIPNENYDDFIFNGFLLRVGPFIVWFYIQNKTEIIEILKSFNNFQKLINMFDKLEKEIESILTINKGNKEISIVVSLFCIIALGTICQLNVDKIIKIIKILVNNYSNSTITNYPLYEKWKKIKELIEKEFKKYRKNKISENIYDYFGNEEKTNTTKNVYRYEIPFRLTLYYLYHINNYKNVNSKINFNKIMNEIYSLSGNKRENAAVVGTIIGPMVGFDNFGGYLENVFKYLDKNEIILSPSLMVIFIYYLQAYKEKIKPDKSEIYFQYKIKNERYYDRNYNTFRMLLNFLYNEIKLCDLRKNNIEDFFNDTFDFYEEELTINQPNKINNLFMGKLKYDNIGNEETFPKSIYTRDLEKIINNKNTNNISDFNLNEIKETKETENKSENSSQSSVSSSCFIY